MSLQTKLIREHHTARVKDALKGLATVYEGQAIDITAGVGRRTKLPIVQVYTPEDSGEQRDDTPRTDNRDCSLVAEVITRRTTANSATGESDLLADLVECVIGEDLGMRGCDEVGIDISKSGFRSSISGQDSQDSAIALRRVEFNVRYIKSAYEPAERLALFRRYGLEVDLDASDSLTDVRDDFELPSS